MRTSTSGLLTRLADDFRDSVNYSIHVLGDSVASLLVYHAKQNFGVDLSRLPVGVERFDVAIRSLLGKGGCSVLVKECSLKLQSSLGVSIETFPESLSDLYRMACDGCRTEDWGSSVELGTHQNSNEGRVW